MSTPLPPLKSPATLNEPKSDAAVGIEPKEQPNDTRGTMIRGGLGGALMGLANLVPGISGGTMLLAAGVYPEFIEAIAVISTL